MSKMSANSIVRKIDDVNCGKIDDEGIILNLSNGDYFRVNSTSLFIWNALSGHRSLAEIAKKVASHFNVNMETALEDVLDFVKELNELKLVRAI